MAKKDTGFWADFKKFVARGNVVDMAVGVIIGGAFKTIIDSLVADIIMPFIGIFVGADTFTSMYFTIGNAQIMFGNFIQAIINFIIMALVIFCIVRALNKFHKKAEEAPAAPSNEEALLAEIRDLLKEKK